MPIVFSCEACKQAMKVPDRVAGKAMKCPTCKTAIRVPMHSTLDVPASTGGPKAPAPTPGPKPQGDVTRVQCPHCGVVLALTRAPPGAKKAKCAKCLKAFDLAAGSAAAAQHHSPSAAQPQTAFAPVNPSQIQAAEPEVVFTPVGGATATLASGVLDDTDPGVVFTPIKTRGKPPKALLLVGIIVVGVVLLGGAGTAAYYGFLRPGASAGGLLSSILGGKLTAQGHWAVLPSKDAAQSSFMWSESHIYARIDGSAVEAVERLVVHSGSNVLQDNSESTRYEIIDSGENWYLLSHTQTGWMGVKNTLYVRWDISQADRTLTARRAGKDGNPVGTFKNVFKYIDSSTEP